MGQDVVRPGCEDRGPGARTCADGNTFLTDLSARLALPGLYTAITRLHHQPRLSLAVIGHHRPMPGADWSAASPPVSRQHCQGHRSRPGATSESTPGHWPLIGDQDTNTALLLVSRTSAIYIYTYIALLLIIRAHIKASYWLMKSPLLLSCSPQYIMCMWCGIPCGDR